MALNFADYRETLSLDNKNEFDTFFKNFDDRCLIDFDDKERMRDDFFKAIQYYVNNGISQKEALKLLDTKYLGDFYVDMTKQRFELDDAAKIMSLVTSYNFTCMFRLSFYLKKEVVPELLQMALNFTIKRFPSFATNFKKGFFWHYLEVSKHRYYVKLENDIPCQPIDISKDNSQLFRVVYFKNRISVELFHVLTDGTGGLAFLKALLFEYLRLTGVDVFGDETILNINENVKQEELENAFEKVPLINDISSLFQQKVVQTEGKLSKNKPCRVIHFKLDATKLKALAKKNNTTVTGYLTSLMFIANKAATNKLHGYTNVIVPMNLRKFYPSKTLRNFSLFCVLCMSIREITDFSSIVRKVDEQLKKNVSTESVIKIVSSAKKIVNFHKYIPLFIKQPCSKLIYRFLSSISFANVFSNLGVVELPNNISKHVESGDFFANSVIVNRLICAAITVNNTTTFSITKYTNNSLFEEKLYDLLCNDGIIPVVEGSEIYED